MEGDTKYSKYSFILPHSATDWTLTFFFFWQQKYVTSKVGKYDPTHRTNIHIKQKWTSMSVQVVSEQKQETSRKQEVYTHITTTKPEVVSWPWRSGACEMLHNTTCLLINHCRSHKLPLCETINTVMAHSLTQSCCFLNNTTPQTWAPQLDRNHCYVTATVEKTSRNKLKIPQVYWRCWGDGGRGGGDSLSPF